MSLNNEHLAKLRKSALADSEIEALGWSSLHNGRLQIPYFRPDGEPELCHDGKPFVRWRLSDLEIEKLKRKGTKQPGKYRSPWNEGCRLYHSRLSIQQGSYSERLNNPRVPLRITEGELKVEAATTHDTVRVTIGLGGVDSWVDHYDGGDDSKPLVEFEEIPFQGREVRLCFDSDLDKPSVATALKKLANFLADMGAHVLIEVLPHDLDGERLGVDDLIYRHSPEAFHFITGMARSPFRERRSAAKEGEATYREWIFSPEPYESHHKAVMAWAVFKDNYAQRPGMGLYRWAGTHWEIANTKSRVPIDKPLHQWMDLMGWTKRSNNVFSASRSELIARLETEDWDDESLMAFANGTLDLKTNELREHRHSDRLTFCFPFPYQPSAPCPTWQGFLAETLGDEDLIRLFRAAFRWTVKPKDRHQPFPHELSFDVFGRKGTGKGTISEVLMAICGGRHGTGRINSATFSNPNALYSLVGKRVAIDPDASGRIQDAGTFNSVASNEPVPVKALYQNVTHERLGVVIWRFFNDQPGASGGGVEGMGRRIVPFHFPRAVAKPDTTLKARLLEEVAGIFWWAWGMSDDEMNQALRNRGAVDAVRVAAAEAALERDPILRFLLETFPDGIERIPAQALFEQWCAWAKAAGHEHGSSTRFGSHVFKVPSVSKKSTNAGNVYRIEPMRDFDVAAHLGIPLPSDTSNPPLDPPPGDESPLTVDGRPVHPLQGGGLNPPLLDNPPPNPPPSDPLQERGDQRMVEGVEGFSLKKFPSNQEEKKAEEDISTEVLAPKPSTPPTSPISPLVETTKVVECVAGAEAAAAGRPELEANADRSNLTNFRRGDQVYVASERLRFGRLHPSVVTKVISAEVHFIPPVTGTPDANEALEIKAEGLLIDPEFPWLGEWVPPQPVQSASSNSCLPELGTVAGVTIEEFERDGQHLRRLNYRQTHADGSESTVAREIPVPKAGWQPLDEDGLDAFLAEVNAQNAAIALGLQQQYGFREAA